MLIIIFSRLVREPFAKSREVKWQVYNCAPGVLRRKCKKKGTEEKKSMAIEMGGGKKRGKQSENGCGVLHIERNFFVFLRMLVYSC